MNMRRLQSLLTILLLMSLLPIASISASQSPLKLVELRTEYKENPLGIDSRKPRLSWQLLASGRAVMQSAYQVRVARSERDVRAGSNLVWDSGQVNSDASVHCPYAGQPLQSGQRYFWQVRIWDAS